MTPRRTVLRFWRRLRRPTLGRLVAASIGLHVGLLALSAWLASGPLAPPPRPNEPLVMELPPAEPGPPLVRPEALARAPRGPGARPALPAPRGPAREPAAPPASSPPAVARAPEAAVPPPPVAERPPEPPPASPPPPPTPAPRETGPAPAPAVVRAPDPDPPPAPGPSGDVARLAPTREAAPPPSVEPDRASPARPAAPSGSPVPAPAPPIVAARPPEPAGRAPGPARPETGTSRSEPSTPWWGGGSGGGSGRSYSLLGPRIEPPAAPAGIPPSGSGGIRARGDGGGDSGYEKDGQPGIPLNTTDPRYSDYFAEIKRRVEAHWVYPEDARRKGQSGQGLVAFVVRKNGSLREVEIVRSSGIDVLDRYLVNAIRFASPLPPIPDRIGQDPLPIVVSFTYVLDHGVRVFGLR